MAETDFTDLSVLPRDRARVARASAHDPGNVEDPCVAIWR
jgi:hypothetical protein